MSVKSNRIIQITFEGDIAVNIIQSALENEATSGIIEYITLLEGFNIIVSPAIEGFVVTGLTIIPPAGNDSIITLKGVDTDTGIELHLTDPTSISLHSTFVDLVLDAFADIVGVRLVWS